MNKIVFVLFKNLTLFLVFEFIYANKYTLFY